jgi:hypothetical protein
VDHPEYQPQYGLDRLYSWLFALVRLAKEVHYTLDIRSAPLLEAISVGEFLPKLLYETFTCPFLAVPILSSDGIPAIHTLLLFPQSQRTKNRKSGRALVFVASCSDQF